MTRIEEILKDLPRELQREVEDFARSLAARHQKHAPDSQRRITGKGWGGALAHLKDRYKSGVDLQHDLMRGWGRND